MCEKDIEDVLLINWNLVREQLRESNFDSIRLNRDYLTQKISNLLKVYRTVIELDKLSNRVSK